LTAKQYKDLKHHDFSGTPFPNYDRGRFPRDRRRRGGTSNYSSRLIPSVTSGLTPLVPSAPMAAEPSPTAIPIEASNNASNLLPSTSPGIETRGQSATVIDLEDREDEAPGTRTIGIAPTDLTELDELVSKFGYEELKKKFAEMERPLVPVQHRASPTPDPIAQITDATDPLLDTDDAIPINNEMSSIAQKQQGSSSAISNRPSEAASEAASEPRKRKQSLSKILSTAPERISPTDLQHLSSTNTSLEAEMQNFYRKALQRLHYTNVPDRPGVDYERPRIGLLRVACGNSDFFYLRLHQLFCVDAMYRRNGRATPSLEDAHRRGLEVLSYLLVPNENLSGDAIEWFSSFPLPWDVLHPSRPAFHSANVKVLNCLVNLSSHWEAMRCLCKSRAYPPLVEEMTACFDVGSFTFQQVIFLALLRQIWKGPQDHCYQLTEAVFPNNYNETMLRRSRNDPEDANQAYRQFVIGELKYIALCHRNHMQQQAYQRKLLPSQHGQAVPVQTKSNEQHHDPRSLPIDSTQQGLQSFQTSSSDPTMSPLSAAPHSRPSIIPGPLPRQYSSPSQALAINTATNVHSTSLTQSPKPLQGLQDSSMTHGYDSSRQFQDQQTRTSHPVFASPISSRSLPSEIIANHILPSNVPTRSVTHSTSVVQQPAYPHSPYIDPYSPTQPGPQYEAQRLRLERSRQPQTGRTGQQNLTQFIRADPNLVQSQPNPKRNALHQAHVRSPVLSMYDLEGKPINTRKTFRFIKHVIMPPAQVSSEKRFLKWDFNIEKALANTLVRDTPGSYGSPSLRTLLPGSRLCRIRCINVDRASGSPSQHEWVVSDNVWHSSTAIVLNGNVLEIRQKSHHGKDLPIDATSYVKEGINSISTAVIGFSEDSITRYAIGVEIVEIIEEQLIKRSIAVLPWQEARTRIIGRLENLDPDVLVVDSQLVIDLNDPFSAQIFVVPVRGTYCRHNECFDRDIFLETRNSTNAKEPCGPDEFRCPICGSDARPQSLVIDGFLVQVREKLQQIGRLDAKAIILHSSGDWDIKEEEEVTGEQGDGSGIRNTLQCRPFTGRQSTAREVIQID